MEPLTRTPDGYRQGLSARAMATAVALDPQFILPALPRLLEHLVVIALPDGLIVEGTGARQVLRGRAATELLPALVPLLDGSRRVDELATALGRSPAHIHAAISLLYTCGLVEDATDAPRHPARVPDDVAAYIGRHLDTTRVNRNGATALTRLATSRVTVVGDGATDLAAVLRDAGIGHVAATGRVAADETDLVVVLGDEPDLVSAVEDGCEGAGVPWLRTACTDAGIEVGPRFESGETACYRCFAREWVPSDAAGAPGPLRRAAWLGLVADEVVTLLSRVGTLQSTSGVTTVDLDDWQERTTLVPRRPDCFRCFPTPVPDEPPLAYRYELAVAFPPRHLLNPKDHQHHYVPSNLALQTMSKRYPAARHVPLVAPELTPVPADRPGDAVTAVDPAVLSGLLLRTAGRRGAQQAGRKPRRWAPTGGNLGSVQVYLLAAGVDWLTPDWYFYDAAQHRLALVRRCGATGDGAGVVGAPPAPPRPTAADLTARIADDRVPTPPALLVMTGALDRVARKYFDFAYRIVHLDAGVATAQLQAVATGYGLTTRVALRWDDELLHEELRLNPDEEPVTAVVGLYGKERP